MIHVYDSLSGEEKKITSLITVDKHDFSCIITIPHSSTNFIAQVADNYVHGKDLLIGTDLFTDDLYKMDFGTLIVFGLNNYCVNVGRYRNPPQGEVPDHMKRNPLYGKNLFGGEIIKEHYTQEQEEELLVHYESFHDALQNAIAKMKEEKGYALIFDCHSMNSVGLGNAAGALRSRPQFVISNLHGKSAHPDIWNTFSTTLSQEGKKYGWEVAQNDPFYGGAITSMYHDPENDVHIIQIETNKALYMHEGLADEKESFTVKKEGLAQLQNVILKGFKRTITVTEKMYKEKIGN